LQSNFLGERRTYRRTSVFNPRIFGRQACLLFMARPMEQEPDKMPKDVARIWAEGYGARLLGLDRLDNPYLDCADAHERRWDDGWLFADAELAKASVGSVNENEPHR
jgi:hypothetical protein